MLVPNADILARHAFQLSYIVAFHSHKGGRGSVNHPWPLQWVSPDCLLPGFRIIPIFVSVSF